jgi:hypothetical protein
MDFDRARSIALISTNYRKRSLLNIILLHHFRHHIHEASYGGISLNAAIPPEHVALP